MTTGELMHQKNARGPASSTTVTHYLSHITNDTDDSKPPDATLPSRMHKTLDLPCLPMQWPAVPTSQENVSGCAVWQE